MPYSNGSQIYEGEPLYLYPLSHYTGRVNAGEKNDKITGEATQQEGMDK